MRPGTRNTIEAWLGVLLLLLACDIVGFIIGIFIFKEIFGITFGA